ncbi:DUF4062 domain-containing protein [Desulfonatronospira sp.]|uniref:DUF4062 domain-containing protein n=1 Tax=Desulfonatronospira sp. TaxID=1962951 RepID=UPI0025C548FF|nr:DUF4062 domain-containing protein [Desulfonatronospira sp.]
MAYQATIIPVMIASPGDVHEYRSIVRDVLHEWNYVNSASSTAMMMPVGWETHSSPELGSSPQELINDRVLEDCDLLVGIFWTRLGTPTTASSSGTAEEIERHLKAGKPAMVYFCSAPAALDTVDPDQYAALKDFREWCKKQGIVEFFDNAVDFEKKLRRHLQITIQKNPYLGGLLQATSTPSSVITPVVTSTPLDPMQQEASLLSEEARILLVEASQDKNGTILKLATFGGRYIQSRGKTFGDPSDRRSSAKWEYALEQLLSAGFVLARGHKDQVFELSEPGYRMAEYLESREK